MTKWIMVRWLTDSKKEVESIVDFLLENRWIACANIHADVESRYLWKGKIDSCVEYEVLMKTNKEHLVSIENYISQHSSYETPAVMVIPIERALKAYEKWLEEELSSNC